MTPETFNAILIFLGAVVGAIAFIADRTNRRANENLPPSILPLILGLLDLADTLAQSTPTVNDDELVRRIRDLLQPPTVPTEGVKAAVDQRLVEAIDEAAA